MITVCLRCKGEFSVRPSTLKIGKGKYCSRLCSDGEKVERKCAICAKVLFIHLSRVKDGRGKFCSRKCYEKDWTKRIPGWNKGKEAVWAKGNQWRKGKPNPNPYTARGEKSATWKGGITPINKKIRNSLQMQKWRKAVFERDNYTCKMCGQVGKYLNADHIKPFAYFPKLRFAISNGRTLCVPCHRKTDTYGGRSKNLLVD